MIRYLLDELYHYEHHYGDALRTSGVSSNSFLEEQVEMELVTVGTMERALSDAVGNMERALSDSRIAQNLELKGMMEGMMEGMMKGMMTNMVAPLLNNPASHTAAPSSSATILAPPVTATHIPMPATVIPDPAFPPAIDTSPSHGRRPSSYPLNWFPPGLCVPEPPLHTPSSRSWRFYIQDWTQADPSRGHNVALRDWDPDWYTGKKRCVFASQRKRRERVYDAWIEYVPPLLFGCSLNTHHSISCGSDEESFLAAWPEALINVTALLKAIDKKRREDGSLRPRATRV